MADLTRHEADLINEDRREQAQLMQSRLEKMGVQVRIAHFTGDSSYPVEYTLRYSFVSATGPTMDSAVADFIEKCLKYIPVERA